MANDAGRVTYTITSRLQTTGDLAIVLHLYHDGQHALTTTVMSCGREDLAAALQNCRAHLKKLDIKEIPRLPSAAGL